MTRGEGDGYNHGSMTDFPLWALGLGAGLIASAVCLILSLRMQSYANRIRVSAYEIERRVRTLTTFALAGLLLAAASFALGLPLSSSSLPSFGLPVDLTERDSLVNVTNTPSFEIPTDAARVAQVTGEPEIMQDELIPAVPLTNTNGADDMPEPTPQIPLPTESLLPTETPADTPTATPTPTNTPTPTPTPTNTPTNTPTPTPTPTPITADTALVNTNGSTLWLRDTPGGQNIALMQDRDLIILEAGNANYAGLVWKEIRTLDGVAGWVERRFLQFE